MEDNDSAQPLKAEIEAIADKLAELCGRAGKSDLGEKLDEAANILYEAVDRWPAQSPMPPSGTATP